MAEWPTVTNKSGSDETAGSDSDGLREPPRFAGWYEALRSAEELKPDSLRSLEQALGAVERTSGAPGGHENTHLVHAFNNTHRAPTRSHPRDD